MAIVTLTSDFGSKDYLAGAFKGRLLNQYAQIQIIDITHEVSPFNFAEAAYIISNSAKHFPDNSFHLLLVSLFDTTKSLPILAYHSGQYFATANNGLLPMVLGQQPEMVVALPLTAENQYNTLAWADCFGKAIKHVLDGLPMLDLGSEPNELIEKTQLLSNYDADFIDGRIIFIDRFENVVVNITKQEFHKVGKGRPFSIHFKSKDSIQKISDGYPMVSEGSKLAFFNAAGYLEIAVNKGNAAGLFGLQTFDHLSNPEFLKSRMFYQTVRVLFY